MVGRMAEMKVEMMVDERVEMKAVGKVALRVAW